MKKCMPFVLGAVVGVMVSKANSCISTHSNKANANDRYAELVGERNGAMTMLLEDFEVGTVDFNWLKDDVYHKSKSCGHLMLNVDSNGGYDAGCSILLFEDIGSSFYAEFTYKGVRYLVTAEVDQANCTVTIRGKGMPTSCQVDLRNGFHECLLNAVNVSMMDMPYLKMPLSDVEYARECSEWVEVEVSRCKDIVLKFMKKKI